MRKNAETIHVLVASLKMTAMVKLTTEKNTMDKAPEAKASFKR